MMTRQQTDAAQVATCGVTQATARQKTPGAPGAKPGWNRARPLATALVLILAATLVTAAPWTHGPARAHGPHQARYGGVVQTASDLSFELVAGRDETSVHLIDHDEPMDASGITGRLTILAGKERTEVELKPAGGNRMVAATVLPADARVVATLVLPGGKPVTVRFGLKR